MTEMAREAVGLATWEELSHSEREALIARKIWYSAEHSKWLIEQEEALAAMYKNKMTKGKSKKKAMKDDYDDYDY